MQAQTTAPRNHSPRNYAPRDGDWQPILLSVFPDRPDDFQPMLPMTVITALYAQADGLVPQPAGYDAPDGVLANMVRTRLKKEVNAQTMQQARRTWHYFENRHIDRRWRIEHRPALPNQGRPVSQTFGNLQADWDHVMAFRDRILQREGLDESSPPRELARAFAWELCRNWRGGGPRNHPADVLTHRSWCLGAATTATALLESLGVPCRGSAVSEHATCEAFHDGQWHLIDSSSHIITRQPPSTPFLPTDYAALAGDPASPDHGQEINDYHRGLFYHFADAHYGIPDGRWIRETLIEHCPAYAQALYPCKATHRFKTLDPRRLDILKRDKVPAVHHFKLWQDLHPGDRLRDDFHLGDLAGMAGLEMQLRLYPHPDAGRLPTQQELAHLTLHLNDQSWPVSAIAPEPWLTYSLDPGRLTLRLPVDALSPDAINTIRWENRSAGDGCPFRFALLPCVALPI